MIDSYPIGLHAKTNYFRCCSTTWNKDTQDFILSRMQASQNNIKPVMVIEADESITMYMPNDDLTQLIEATKTQKEIHSINITKCKAKAHWMKERTKIQKSNMPDKEKEKQIKALNP